MLATAQIPQIGATPPSLWDNTKWVPISDSVLRSPYYTGMQGFGSYPLGYKPFAMNRPHTITRLYLKTYYPTNHTTYTDFELRLGTTPLDGYPYSPSNTVAWNYATTNLKLVFSRPSITFSNIDSFGTIYFDLDSSFLHIQPGERLVIDIRFRNFTGDGINLAHSMQYHANMVGIAPYTNGVRITEQHKRGLLIHGIDITPDWDAGLHTFVSPKDTFCFGPTPIRVVVHNAGDQPIDSLRVNWEANGIPQPFFTYRGRLNPNDTDTTIIGSYNFPANTPVTIKAWSSHPQGTADVFNNNDTIQQAFTATKNFISNFNVFAGNDTAICEGDTIVLSAGSGSNTLVTFLWDNSSTTPTRQIHTGGYYYVIVTDTSGCERMDDIRITSQRPLVSLGNERVICLGEQIVMDAGNPGCSYIWDDMSTSRTRNVSQPGRYYVYVTDNIGCTAHDDVLVSWVTAPTGRIQAVHQQGLTYNFSLQNPVGVSSVEWRFGDGNFSTMLAPTHTYATDGTYNITAHLQSHCLEVTGYDTFKLVIANTNIQEVTHQKGIEVYPNPFDGKLTIALATDHGSTYNLSITDITGRKIYEQKGTINELNQHLQTAPAHWQIGQYILQLRDIQSGKAYSVPLIGTKE
jgi:PKD repeat protein